jgi:hypothetical protein
VFPLVSEQLADELRETIAGAANAENRQVLKRLRELIDACDGPSRFPRPAGQGCARAGAQRPAADGGPAGR